MKIFLSYASDYRPIADDLCCRLQAVGHEVFFDREDLPAGESYDERIRSAIDECALFIFLITPESVAEGHYTRTELKIASRKWPTPGWHVLPVQVADTPLDQVPAYLRALTILHAEGNLAAEVLFEVEDLARRYGGQPSQQTVLPPATHEPEAPGEVHYRSLQLRFARDAAGAYSVTVPDSPAGAHAAAGCLLDAGALEETLWAGAAAIEGSARRVLNGTIADTLLPTAAGARQAGQALYAALLASPVGRQLEDSLRTIDPQRGQGLRFVIDTTAAPDLARLPWEFLYRPDKDDFIFSDRLKPVVRWLEVDEPPPTLTVRPPLRLLIAVAAPGDRPGLQVGEEIAQLDEALSELTGGGQVHTTRLDHASLERLDDALLRERPHVLHFIGHGDFSADEGVLVLESDATAGASDIIAGRQLAVLLRNHLTSLRLVFLNSCMGATASHRDPFAGVAQSLIHRGMPAVIAMQFPIPDKAAVALARHFYRYLAAGQPVDAALNSARAFMYARGYGVEWGAPALHMRASDGRLFDLRSAPSAAAQAPAVEIKSIGLPPQLPASVPVTAPLPEALPARSNRRIVLAAVIVGVLLLAAIGLWFALSREPAMPIPSQDPMHSQIRPPHPTAAPVVEPKAQPDTQRLAQEAIAQLKAGNTEQALQSLQALRAGDASALTAQGLGPLHAQLAQGLAQSAERAFKRGDLVSALAVSDELAALEPFDPALEASIRKHVEPWLSTLRHAMDSQTAAGGAMDEPMSYIVRRGDTLWRIAQRLTGDGRNWHELFERNNRAAAIGIGEPIADPHRIRPGQHILVPPSQTGANVIEYHVARGESLSRIAARVYGDPRLWRQIQRDNADQIANPALIHPGQVLLLRPAPR